MEIKMLTKGECIKLTRGMDDFQKHSWITSTKWKFEKLKKNKASFLNDKTHNADLSEFTMKWCLEKDIEILQDSINWMQEQLEIITENLECIRNT